MFSPSPSVPRCSMSWGPQQFLPAARVWAQTLASAASLSLHTSGGTPTAARSLLCSARILSASTPCEFPVLLLSCVVGVDGDRLGVVLHVELSVPGPQPAVVGAAGACCC